MRVALASCEQPPVPDRDAAFILPALEALGATGALVAWTDPDASWQAYDRVLISSTWDYHGRLDDFRGWLRGLSASGVQVENPHHLVEWNIDKRYLGELEDPGVPTIPTVWGGPGDASRTTAEVAQRGWGEVIVKPVVDLGAMNLVRTDPGGVLEAAAAIDGHHLVQPFLPSVERDGELSLVLLAGEISHAVVKRPVAGDFRVQPQYGGEHSLVEDVASHALDVAARTMAAIDAQPLYARVDLVRDLEDRWCCIELELIEPLLYLDVAGGAAERLAGLLVG